VITQVASFSDAIGCLGLLVHAESERAPSFYEHLTLAGAGVGGGSAGRSFRRWLQARWSDRQGR
jgi:hypothetical protein